MNSLALLLTSLDVGIIYDVSYAIAKEVMSFLTPILFLMAIVIRMMETSAGNLAGNGKYNEMFRDFIVFGLMIGLYIGLGVLVLSFFNAIYKWIDSIGSLEKAMESYTIIMDKNAIDVKQSGLTLAGAIAAPSVVIAQMFYWGSLIILAFIAEFLKIANAVVFGLAFIWGLVAIPISISTTFRILRGWGWLMALALVWPIVQGFLMAMFVQLFAKSAASMTQMTDIDPLTATFDLLMLFSVLNLILAAILLAAPVITNALVTNGSAGASIVMPFVGAALAAGMSAVKGRDAAGQAMKGSGVGGLGGGSSRSSGSNIPVPRAAPVSAPKASASSADSAPSTSTAPAPAAASSGDAAKQRKGAIITQFRKARTPTPRTE